MSEPRWHNSEATLVERIRDEIAAAPGQRITFARFMERALTEPGIGYYASTELRPTRSGDFLTAPELHPFFGRCIGRFLEAAWRHLGRPDLFVVREFGAGRGALRDSVLSGLATDARQLHGAMEWQALDLPDRNYAGERQRAPHVVLANEYLDALPVHRVVQLSDRLRERYVAWRDGWFAEVLDEPSTPEIEALFKADGVELRDGQQAEVCLAAPAWMTSVARDAAMVLLLDYGHDAHDLYGPKRMAGSLLTYREHEVDDDPYSGVGRTDITAHVDITAIERAAREHHLLPIGSTSQARFLAALGLGELLAELGQDPTTEAQQYLAARSAVRRLIDPRHLGAFRVLAWRSASVNDPVPPFPGFEATP